MRAFLYCVRHAGTGVAVDEIRDRCWDVYARIGARLGLYTKCASTDGRYYYVRGPGLAFPHFCVIAEELEHDRDKWVKGGFQGGGPHAILLFSLWKLKLRNYSKATFAEADWYRGFVELDRCHRSQA